MANFIIELSYGLGKQELGSRRASMVAFLWFLRYNIMDYQQGGNTFERKFKR